jgi:hypothetical protein
MILSNIQWPVLQLMHAYTMVYTTIASIARPTMQGHKYQAPGSRIRCTIFFNMLLQRYHTSGLMIAVNLSQDVLAAKYIQGESVSFGALPCFG